MIDSLVRAQVIVGVNNAGAAVLGAHTAPTLVGVYDIVLSVAVNPSSGDPTLYSNGSRIPIVGAGSAGHAPQDGKAGIPAAVAASNLSIISGNNQTAVTGAAFAIPVVQVNSGSDPVAGYTVQFGLRSRAEPH